MQALAYASGQSDTVAAVFGSSTNTGPYFSQIGVYGQSLSNSPGVYGFSTGDAGYGVYGVASGENGYAGYFTAPNSGDANYGIYSITAAASGFSGWFTGGSGLYADKVNIPYGGKLVNLVVEGVE